jgi:hypothetical protein
MTIVSTSGLSACAASCCAISVPFAHAVGSARHLQRTDALQAEIGYCP